MHQYPEIILIREKIFFPMNNGRVIPMGTACFNFSHKTGNQTGNT